MHAHTQPFKGLLSCKKTETAFAALGLWRCQHTPALDITMCQVLKAVLDLLHRFSDLGQCATAATATASSTGTATITFNPSGVSLLVARNPLPSGTPGMSMHYVYSQTIHDGCKLQVNSQVPASRPDPKRFKVLLHQNCKGKNCQGKSWNTARSFRGPIAIRTHQD